MHDNFSKTISVEKEKSKGEGSQFYSPLVLSIAQKENVSFDELRKISGTGLDSRVTKKDILSYIENRSRQKVSSKPVEEKLREKQHPPRHLFLSRSQNFFIWFWCGKNSNG